MARSIRNTVGLGVTAIAALGLVAAAGGTAVSAPHARALVSATPTLKVHVTKKKLTISGASGLQAGRVALNVTGSGIVEIALFKKGYTFKDLRADIAAFGQSEGPNGASKAGIKHLDHAIAHTTLYGGLSGGLTGTVVLPKPGSYVAFNDTGNLPIQPKTLKVTGPEATRATPTSTGTAKAMSGDRWGGSSTLPAKGTFTFKNVSSGASRSPHFLELQHVKKGTTRKQVLKSVRSNSQGPPSFALQGTLDTDAISPGLSLTVNDNLPKGTYAELCFFPDPRTGMPHALMGMVRIVHLK
jgi:hypothetical protein